MSSQGSGEEDKGIIGRVYEDGLPVLYSFVNELPDAEVRNELQWLTVISWKYDGADNRGMPPAEENQKMIQLEDVIREQIEDDKVLRHVYSRTGNNLKELVYYIHGQEQFLELFNDALSDHPRYPIEIKFFEDKAWEDFSKLLEDFSNAPEKKDGDG